MGSVIDSGSRLQLDLHFGGTKLTIKGTIDEHASFAPVLPALKYPLTIDLGGVERINSLGTRLWIAFIDEVTARGPVWLERCSDVLVHQFGYVSTMLGSARVRSVLAPYVCTLCDAIDYHEVVIDQDFDPALPHRAPASKRCSACAGESQFDEVTDSYFLFLRS